MTSLSQADARGAVKASKLPKYQPHEPIATFIDNYGDERIIHKPKGAALRVFTGRNTVPAKINPAVGILLGQKLKARRLELGLTMNDVAVRAGIAGATHPKAYIHQLEGGGTKSGSRFTSPKFGTLYALAYALECTPQDLMPTMEEVLSLAEIGDTKFKALSA